MKYSVIYRMKQYTTIRTIPTAKPCFVACTASLVLLLPVLPTTTTLFPNVYFVCAISCIYRTCECESASASE